MFPRSGGGIAEEIGQPPAQKTGAFGQRGLHGRRRHPGRGKNDAQQQTHGHDGHDDIARRIPDAAQRRLLGRFLRRGGGLGRLCLRLLRPGALFRFLLMTHGKKDPFGNLFRCMPSGLHAGQGAAAIGHGQHRGFRPAFCKGRVQRRLSRGEGRHEKAAHIRVFPVADEVNVTALLHQSDGRSLVAAQGKVGPQALDEGRGGFSPSGTTPRTRPRRSPPWRSR